MEWLFILSLTLKINIPFPSQNSVPFVMNNSFIKYIHRVSLGPEIFPGIGVLSLNFLKFNC